MYSLLASGRDAMQISSRLLQTPIPVMMIWKKEIPNEGERGDKDTAVRLKHTREGQG